MKKRKTYKELPKEITGRPEKSTGHLSTSKQEAQKETGKRKVRL